MRSYANGDGYVKINATAREGMEARVQLDCSSNGKSISYPLHLIASFIANQRDASSAEQDTDAEGLERFAPG